MAPRVNLLFALSFSFFLSACQPESENSSTNETAQTSNTVTEATSEISSESSEQEQRRLLATFPAQQRAPADPELIAEGELIYGINCRACHGVDLRGGDLGGPNLLRSLLVLNDIEGELISPVLEQGRSNPGMTAMPPQNLTDHQMVAVSAYVHAIVATSRGQGSPPLGEQVELNILVGDPEAGQQYFEQECTACHSITGDLQGIASQITEPMDLQDSWVAGRRRGAPSNPDADPTRRLSTATVTLTSGESFSGVLKRRDDFILSLTTEQGQHKSFALMNNPELASVEVNNPMERHLKLLSEYTDDIMHNVTAYLVTLK